MSTVSERFFQVQSALQSAHVSSLHAAPSLPQLIAVSKTFPVDSILELMALGQFRFGENYVQELCEKQDLILARIREDKRDFAPPEFHFIGQLQTNKIKALLPRVRAIHSVATLKHWREVFKYQSLIPLECEIFFQVNIDREPQKSGFLPEELSQLSSEVQSKDLSPKVRLSGLMAIPEIGTNSSSAFERMKGLSQDFSHILGTGLSMGMSDDFENAIYWGATHVRVGSALFGKRKTL